MPFMTKYPGVLYLAVILIGVNIDTGLHGRCICMSAFSYKTEFLRYVIIKLYLSIVFANLALKPTSIFNDI